MIISIFGHNGNGDYDYLKKLGLIKEVNIIEPTLKAYDELLEKTDIDFVGTRLHGGIRAMQKCRRAIIISIDNRAKEMSKNYNIKIVERDNMENLEKVINSEFNTIINLPEDNIKKWKEQFKK